MKSRDPSMPSAKPKPAISLSVVTGQDFRVTNGANLGDALSFADDLELDDIYGLAPDTEAALLALRVAGDHFKIAETSSIGAHGATVCLDCALILMSPDGTTTEALVFVELDKGGHVVASYLHALIELEAKTDYNLVGIDTKGANQKLAQIACVSFSRGTCITLSTGAQKPVEDLRPGDRILTRESGPQKLRWIGQSTARAVGSQAPVCIREGVLNNARDLIVSPDHRLFIYQRSDRIGAGRSELLVKARHLVNDDTVFVMDGGHVDYFQLVFDTHQIIYAEGIAAETLLIDSQTAPALPEDLAHQLAKGRSEPGDGMHDLDVSRALLDRPDATDILRRASRS